MDNQQRVPSLLENELVGELSWWVSTFQIMFFKNQPIPTPMLTFEKTRVNTLGSHRTRSDNGTARGQINLNGLHLDRPLWSILNTLLHEIVHLWEHTYVDAERRTKNWYHSKAFREKMLKIGIITDTKGCHIAVTDPFVFFLKKHGVEVPLPANGDGTVQLPPLMKTKGQSKLKKWSCGCTNVRVAVRNFQARCLKCQNRFVLT